MTERTARSADRREFLKSALALAGAGVASGIGLGNLAGCARHSESLTPLPSIPPASEIPPTPTLEPSPTDVPFHEAMFYQSLPEQQIQCQVCFRQCVVEEGELGFCRNKQNIAGKYYQRVYGKPCSLQVDPIEKEPSFHMYPGSMIFCTGTASCNQRCKFCQNWHMSQHTLEELRNYDALPADVVRMAMGYGCKAVSFTYNEPTVFYEQMYDTVKIAKKSGLGTLFHTNGTMNPEPLLALLQHMDAVTIDLKAFTPEFYQRVCESELWPVKRTIQNVRKTDTHLELVNLMIPTKNDDPEDIRRMCAWVVENAGSETPLHFTRFFPAYKYQAFPPTPVETLEAAAEIADEEGLQYVYIGNYPGHIRNSTYCPNCGEMVIGRVHFAVFFVNLTHGRCGSCDHSIPGVWGLT